MRSLSKFRREPKPFLSPLASSSWPSRLFSRSALHRLPAAAAPIAVTLAGSLVLVAGFAIFLGGEPTNTPQQTPASVDGAPAPAVRDTAAAGEPPVAEPEPTAGNAERPAGGVEAASGESGTPAPRPGGIARDGAPAAAAAVPPQPADPSDRPDPSPTASILTALPDVGTRPTDGVAVAETEEELAALEAIQRQEVEADLATPDGEETASIGQEAAPAMRAATTNRYVNMRSGPDDAAEVLAVVPARAEIEAEDDCDWCAVVWEGRSGYIYRTFISYR